MAVSSYIKTDGTPIGKLISGPLAGIFMNWFEKTYILNADSRFKPLLWKCMRDDIFIIWDQGDQDFDCLIWHLDQQLMGIEPRIHFTVEKEINNKFPFLDMLIQRKDDRLITKVYRKPTHTPQYINWRSNHPKNALLGVLKGLIHRAHPLCELDLSIHQEEHFLGG